MGYGLGIDVGTRTVVVAIRQGDDQRVLSQVINPPEGPTPAADAERYAFAIRRALQAAEEVTGASPDTVALTYPAGAGPYGFNLVRRAAELIRLEAPYLISDVEAAVAHHVSLGEWASGELLACVDLGDIDYGRPGEDASADEVTVAVLRVTPSNARLVGPARALPVEQSAPVMHAAVSTTLRRLLTSAGLEPQRLSGLLLVGEGALAPGATGRLAERLVELLGPDLGTTSKLITAPAHAAALGAAAIAAHPESVEADEDVYGPTVVASAPYRPRKQPIIGFPVLLGSTAAAPRLSHRWLGALAACTAAVAVGAGAFVVTDSGSSDIESPAPRVEEALTSPVPTTTTEATAEPIPTTTSLRIVAHDAAQRPLAPSTSTSTIHVSTHVSTTRPARTSSAPTSSSSSSSATSSAPQPTTTDPAPSSSSPPPSTTPDDPPNRPHWPGHRHGPHHGRPHH